MKKILCFVLSFIFMFSLGFADKAYGEEDYLENFEMTGLDLVINTDMDFYSVNDEMPIGKDTEIVFQTEDGSLKRFKTTTLTNGKSYFFRIPLDQLGLWKLVELDGKAVTSRSRDFTVHKNQKAADDAQEAKRKEDVRKANEKANIQKNRIWDGEMNVVRIAGKDRYETAVKTSQYSFKKDSKYAVIATGEGFIDGLVGGSLTAQIDAPLLLVRKNNISTEVLNEIKRLDPEEIFILGGEAVVSESIEKDIKALDFAVERLAGKNRIETAEEIAEKRWSLLPKAFDKKEIAMISGTNFPDALTGTPLIGEVAKKGQNFYSILPYMKGGKYPEVDLAIGGEAVVPVKAKSRIAGDDRYKTGMFVARNYVALHGLNKKADTLVIVDGRNFPDGLTAASVASTQNGIVTLVGNNIPEINIEFLMDYAEIKNIIILGGESAVSADIEDTFTGKIKPPEIHGYRFE